MRNVIIGLMLFCLVPLLMLSACKKKEDAPTYAPQVSTGTTVSYTKFVVEDKQFVLINVNGVNQIMEWSEKGSKH